MKIYVYTDNAGKIIGTSRESPDQSASAPAPAHTSRVTGQIVRELELSPQLEQLQDVAKLHEELAKLIRRS